MTKMLSASGGFRPPDQGLCPWTPLGALPPDPRYRLVLRTRHGAPPTTDPFRRLCYSAHKLICYRRMEGGRLSRPRHCSKGAQPVPKTVYRSSCRDKHNRPRRDLNLDPLTAVRRANHSATATCDVYREGKCADTIGTVSRFPGLAVYDAKMLIFFRIKNTEAILSNSTRKLLWFQTTTMLIAV